MTRKRKYAQKTGESNGHEARMTFREVTWWIIPATPAINRHFENVEKLKEREFRLNNKIMKGDKLCKKKIQNLKAQQKVLRNYLIFWGRDVKPTTKIWRISVSLSNSNRAFQCFCFWKGRKRKLRCNENAKNSQLLFCLCFQPVKVVMEWKWKRFSGFILAFFPK